MTRQRRTGHGNRWRQAVAALAAAAMLTGLAVDAGAVALDAVSLRDQLAAAQAQYQTAQQQQVDADVRLAFLARELAQQQAAAETAQRQIERYARWAYIAARDAEVANVLIKLAAGDQESLAEAQILLASVGNVQARELREAVAVLQRTNQLRAEMEQARATATNAMTEAQRIGDEAVARLEELAAIIGPEPLAPTTTPMTCPKVAPPGSLTDGAEQIGVRRLCRMSVKQARSPAAARAIVWAFNHLGVPYSMTWTPVDDELFPTFHCANFIARAYYWGARISAFLTLPWTPAYANPPAFIQPVQGPPQSGDINIMWRGEGGIAASGGAAGHAQLLIADGWVIQSGGIAGHTNVARYPNGWPDWQEVQFAVNAVA
ncbi:MAG: hypothetical protein Q8P61_00590 [Candidatus Nanopelagicales bacterium]|nr:hypothetical protein [Candidatus Nanopelagicales bacterium]